MGSKSKRNANLIFWGLIFITGIVVFGLVSTDSEVMTFEINSLSTADSSSSDGLELPNVNCFVKTSVRVLDAGGNVIASDESPFLEKRPKYIYSVLQVGDEKIADRIQIVPKIKCNIDNDVPMSVKNAQLKATIFAKDETGKIIEVWNDNKQNTKDIKITKHDSELMTFTANQKDIFKFLPEGDYTTILEIKIRGVIDVSYDAVPNFLYEVLVGEESIKTFVEATVVDNQEPKNNPPDSAGGNTVEIQDEFVTEFQSIDELILCASTFDTSCMFQLQFLPFYLIGIGGIAIIGALTTKNKPPLYDQFGNRIA